MFNFEGLNICRISFLGGEPRHFTYSLSIVLLILILLNYLKILKSNIIFMLIMLVILVNLILTFSTHGYIIFLFNMLILLFSLLYFKGLKKKFSLYFLISISAIIVFLVLNPLVFQLVKFMTIDRLLDPSLVGANTATSIEDWNEAFIGFIK